MLYGNGLKGLLNMRDKIYDAKGLELLPGDRVTSKIGTFKQAYVSDDWLTNVPEGEIRVYVNLLPIVTKKNTIRQRRKYYTVNPRLVWKV